MPSSIQARLKLSPSMWASFGSARSVTTAGASQVESALPGIPGRNPDSQRPNAGASSTRHMKSASARQGDKKSSPEGS